MARAMDVLKGSWPGFQRGHLDTFVNWVQRVIMPEVRLSRFRVCLRGFFWLC